MKKELKDYSLDALRGEVEKREREDELPPPKPNAKPDFSVVIETVTKGIETAIAENYQDGDFKHHVYEAVMEAIYGKGFWAWHNKQKW